jgi:hypothetical protein
MVKQIGPAAEGVDGGVAAQANASSQTEVPYIAQVTANHRQRNILHQSCQLELGCIFCSRHNRAAEKGVVSKTEHTAAGSYMLFVWQLEFGCMPASLQQAHSSRAADFCKAANMAVSAPVLPAGSWLHVWHQQMHRAVLCVDVALNPVCCLV